MSNERKSQTMVMGVAIYLPHQWERLLATAEDREKLEGTWEEWRAVLEESERNMRAIGIEPVEVVLDMDEFEKYCAERGLTNVGGTRADYVAERLRNQQSAISDQHSDIGSHL
jgi:hypothetical protein